jgi:hypothetical protein
MNAARRPPRDEALREDPHITTANVLMLADRMPASDELDNSPT